MNDILSFSWAPNNNGETLYIFILQAITEKASKVLRSQKGTVLISAIKKNERARRKFRSSTKYGASLFMVKMTSACRNWCGISNIFSSILRKLWCCSVSVFPLSVLMLFEMPYYITKQTRSAVPYSFCLYFALVFSLNVFSRQLQCVTKLISMCHGILAVNFNGLWT